jgi:hypothetical protein
MVIEGEAPRTHGLGPAAGRATKEIVWLSNLIDRAGAGAFLTTRWKLAGLRIIMREIDVSA